MWGSIFLENYINTNYSFSFPSDNSQIIIQLIHWQYWWWFWFTYFIVLYYLLFIRLLNFNLLKFYPKVVTSFRAHGKWGDFLVCVIPISWCLNILTNSNFILRMLEWQMETSLLVVRVRGKQWYWIYKFELSNIISLLNTQKCLGHNVWTFSNKFSAVSLYNYLNILYSLHSNKFLLFYWDNVFLNNFNSFQFFKTGFLSPCYINSSFSFLNIDDCDEFWQPYALNFSFNNYSGAEEEVVTQLILSKEELVLVNIMFDIDPTVNIFIKPFSLTGNLYKIINNNMYDLILSNNLFNFNLNFYYLWDKMVVIINNRLLFLKNILISGGLNKIFAFMEINRLQKAGVKNNLLSISLDRSVLSIAENIQFKEGSHSHSHVYWVMKQKRSSVKMQVDYLNASGFNNYYNNDNSWYSFVMEKNNFFLSQVQQKRLLRTNRILLLPININMTIITNSFDVIHSWYIPGLGIKLDCVPGRSTHHNLNIQNVGFYYGQCAEICGRYHHHMPIRICAVSFHQFLLWWSHFGVQKFVPTEVRTSTTFIF